MRTLKTLAITATLSACGGRFTHDSAAAPPDAGTVDSMSASADAPAQDDSGAILPGDASVKDGAPLPGDAGPCTFPYVLAARTNAVCNCGLEALVPLGPGTRVCPGASSVPATLAFDWTGPGALATVSASSPWQITAASAGTLNAGVADLPSDADVTLVVSGMAEELTITVRVHTENDIQEGGVWSGSVTVLAASFSIGDAGGD
jgi:hypothetical protein